MSSAADRLSHAYALTVHRCQGLTTDTCHHLAEGGGRELAYLTESGAAHAVVGHPGTNGTTRHR